MKTTERFEKAVTKLYKAFHSGELNKFDCSMCAVGNICGKSSKWISLGPTLISYQDNPIHVPNVLETGYSLLELRRIERIFMFGELSGKKYCEHPSNDKEGQFEGLCAVIEYLCELDNIPNPMDYSKLFETENDKPKYELSCVI